MKPLTGLAVALFLVLGGGMTVHAQASVTYSQDAPPADAVTVDWSTGAAEEEQVEPDAWVEDETAADAPDAQTAAVSASIAPVSTETVVEDGVTLVKLTYDVPPEGLARDAFEQDGMRFTQRETQVRELPGETASIPAVKTAVTLTDSDDSAVVLAQFPATIRHEENGYTGQLSLVASSLTTEVEEWDAYSYTYTETEEVGALDRNDPSLLEKERDGMELARLSFSGQRETQVGDSRIPSSYSATLTWQNTVSGKDPVRYLTTATYTGQISRTVPGDTLYTVVYEGAPIPVEPQAVASEPEPVEDSPGEDADAEEIARPADLDDMEEEPEPEETTAFPLLPLLIGESVLVIALLAALLIQGRKHRRDIEWEK